MKYRRLHHVSSPFTKAEKAAISTFYADTLGLTELAPPDSLAHLNLLWFQAGDGMELHFFEGVTDPASQRHFCLDVEDLDHVRRRLEASGAEPYDDVPIPGRPRFFCRDPVGNLVELTHVEGRS